MREWFVLLLMVGLMAPPLADASDWSRNMIDQPAGEKVVNNPGNKPVYFFVIQTAGAADDSSWMLLERTQNYDICFDNDVALLANGTSANTVEVYNIPHSNIVAGKITTPTDDARAEVLLAVILNGIPSTSAATNDCIYNVDGPRWIRINQVGTDANQDGLVSVIQRRSGT